jgi:hypothetical protein
VQSTLLLLLLLQWLLLLPLLLLPACVSKFFQVTRQLRLGMNATPEPATSNNTRV